MIHSVVGIHNGTEFKEYCPYIYTGPNTGINNSGWTPVGALIWDGPGNGVDNTGWFAVGATQTLMVPFYVGGASGNYFMTSDGKIFQVRAHE